MGQQGPSSMGGLPPAALGCWGLLWPSHMLSPILPQSDIPDSASSCLHEKTRLGKYLKYLCLSFRGKQAWSQHCLSVSGPAAWENSQKAVGDTFGTSRDKAKCCTESAHAFGEWQLRHLAGWALIASP